MHSTFVFLIDLEDPEDDGHLLDIEAGTIQTANTFICATKTTGTREWRLSPRPAALCSGATTMTGANALSWRRASRKCRQRSVGKALYDLPAKWPPRIFLRQDMAIL